MRFTGIKTVFVVLTVLLISLMAVSAADLDVYFVKIKTGDPESVKIYSDSAPFCKFMLKSDNADIKAAPEHLTGEVTWTIKGEETEPAPVQNLDFNKYFTPAYNGELEVGDAISCKVDALWTDPVDNEVTFPATKSYSTTVLNTEPELDYDDYTITIEEDSDEAFWNGMKSNQYVSDLDEDVEFLSFALASQSNMVCSLDADGLTYQSTANYYNTNSKDAYCEISVTDTSGGVDSSKVYFKVNQLKDDAATMSAVSAQKVTLGETWTLDMANYVTNPDDYAVSYTLSASDAAALPDLLPKTDTGDKFTWTPTEADIGIYNLKVEGTYNGEGSPISQTFALNVKKPSCLAIKDITAYAGEDGDDKDNGVDQNGGTVDVEPGDKLKLSIEVENVCEEEGDVEHELEKIELEAELEDMGDEDEQTENNDYDDIKVGKNEEMDFNFKIPYDADEGNYQIIIDGNAEDVDTGEMYYLDQLIVTVSVEKEDHKLNFQTFTLNPSTVSCTKNSQLTVKLLNTGSHDEDVQLVVANSELSIEEIDLIDNLEEGDPEDDSLWKKTYNLKIPADALTGSYVVTGKAYYNDDDDTEAASAVLTVVGCGSSASQTTKTDVKTEEDKKEEVEVITTTTGSSSAQTVATADSADDDVPSFFDSSLYVGLLISGIIVVILVIVILMVAISRK